MVLRTGFGKPEMQNLPFLDEFLHRSGHVFDGHLRIDPVLVVKVDVVGLEAFQRCFDHFPDVGGLAIQAAASAPCRSRICWR